MLQDNFKQSLPTNIPPIQVGRVVKIIKSPYLVDVVIEALGYYAQNVPIASGYVGDQYGLVIMPELDDVVLIAFIGGSRSNPVVIGRLYSHHDTPPSLSDSEVAFKHKSGTEVKIEASGDVIITPASGALVKLGGTGGEAVILGDSFKAKYEVHKHMTSQGPSGPPMDPTVPQSTIVEAK